MEDALQVSAYAEADFSEPHNHFIKRLQTLVDPAEFAGTALDLGCGPGDISCRFARAFPLSRVVAVDGSLPMLNYGRKNVPEELRGRIHFIHGMLQDICLPEAGYELILSNSLLHHLPDPAILWHLIARYAQSGSRLAIMDLVRPKNLAEARRLVEIYVRDGPEILQHDFYHSLLAAFTIDEIKAQISACGFNLRIEQISDRHVFISGIMS